MTLDLTERTDSRDWDLKPEPLDQSSDPVGMYLREMGVVPLLTRQGEVRLAKRIERGQFPSSAKPVTTYSFTSRLFRETVSVLSKRAKK